MKGEYNSSQKVSTLVMTRKPIRAVIAATMIFPKKMKMAPIPLTTPNL
jgi:hypothetical protein